MKKDKTLSFWEALGLSDLFIRGFCERTNSVRQQPDKVSVVDETMHVDVVALKKPEVEYIDLVVTV